MRLLVTQLRHRTDAAAENFRAAAVAVDSAVQESGPVDVIVLPELIGAEAELEEYDELVSGFARRFDAFVVGGSHHRCDTEAVTNSGQVANPDGEIIASYDKSRPYGSEVELGISGGARSGMFTAHGWRVLPVICSDFWFSGRLLGAGSPPDLIVVPTFSISQKPAPTSARGLWTHMTVARAYEFCAYVGISDWAHPTTFRGLASSGVAGLGNPRPVDGASFFTDVLGVEAMAFDLDLRRLRDLRQSRSARNFAHQPAF